MIRAGRTASALPVDDRAGCEATAGGAALDPVASPWSQTPSAVAEQLGVNPVNGLGIQEAAQRRIQHGRNALPAAASPSVLRLVLEQLRETMIVVLLAAAAVTVAVGDLADTLIIALVVALNTVLGVVQQRRAQRAIAALTALSAPTARVVRAGRVHIIAAEDVVPGDLLVLEAGDLVSADGRLLEAEGLEVEEAALTGESLPAIKMTDSCPADSPVADRTSMVHAGTLVTRGRARLVVTSTGDKTQVGRLARLLVTTASPSTPLQVRLSRFGRQIALATAAFSLLVFVIGVTQRQAVETMLLTAISLAVAAIPESLPAVLAVSLALAGQRMAHKGAVVRVLPAVEALGAVTVIASDKTGTLTEGTMQATHFWTPAGPVAVDGQGYTPDGALHGDDPAVQAREPILQAIALCNDAHLIQKQGAWAVAGDPLEGALLCLATKGGQEPTAVRQAWTRVSEYAFDHHRARMTTVHRSADGRVIVVCKGAPEVLLDLIDDAPPVMTAARLQVEWMTARGLRVLAVAQVERSDLPSEPAAAEQGLRLLGLIGLHDPPRAAAAAAVAACHRAGVRTIMITGDHPVTAAAIATSLGILDSDGLVVTGKQITEGLEPETLDRIRVYARTAPEQKLSIVAGLRRTGHVVAMTGDGVNDAPALRSADVGVAMGRSGTEVARQAADVVLADDNFSTLVAAIGEGRRIYDNVRRFLFYALSGGFAEVLLMLAGPIVGLPLPLLPGQILWVNMLTHGLPGVALGAERAEDDTLDRAPRDPAEGVLGGGLLRRILLLGTLVGAVSLGIGVWAEGSGHEWQSMVFVTLTLQQLGIALVLRSQTRSIVSVGLRGNRLLMLSLGVNAFLLWLAVSWAPLSNLLDTQALTALELAICLAAAIPAPVGVEAAKAWARKRTGRTADLPRERCAPVA